MGMYGNGQELRGMSIRNISFILSPFSFATAKKKKKKNPQINYKLSLYIKLRQGFYLELCRIVPNKWQELIWINLII